jgi:hypothetical protein
MRVRSSRWSMLIHLDGIDRQLATSTPSSSRIAEHER